MTYKKEVDGYNRLCYVAGEAYQIIGALADHTDTFDHPEVQRALDYFSSVSHGEDSSESIDILPWSLESGEEAQL